jgi:hypothetical protein
MVKENHEYICEVCNNYFKSYEEAHKHEQIPVIGSGLPRGFTFKNEIGNFCVIRRSSASINGDLDEEHGKLYACWTLPAYSDINDNNYYCDTDPIKIPKDLEKILLSDKEFQKVKEMFSKAQRVSCPEHIDLASMTNKLPEGYRHASTREKQVIDFLASIQAANNRDKK